MGSIGRSKGERGSGKGGSMRERDAHSASPVLGRRTAVARASAPMRLTSDPGTGVGELGRLGVCVDVCVCVCACVLVCIVVLCVCVYVYVYVYVS